MTALASLLLQLWCCAMRPTSMRAPDGWYVEGVGTGEVRRRGVFSMRPSPGGDPDADGTHGHPDVTPDDDRVLVGRIYCTAGSPRVTATRVWCGR